MKITLSPMRRDDPLTASVEGDVLTLTDANTGYTEAFDFTQLPEGGELPCEAIACNLFVGCVTREAGEICLTLILPHGGNAPEETRFPQPVACTSGEVPLPPYDAEETPA